MGIKIKVKVKKIKVRVKGSLPDNIKKAKLELSDFVRNRGKENYVLSYYERLWGKPPKVHWVLLKYRIWYHLLRQTFTQEQWTRVSDKLKERYQASKLTTMSAFDESMKFFIKMDMAHGEEDEGISKGEKKMKVKVKGGEPKKETENKKKSPAGKGLIPFQPTKGKSKIGGVRLTMIYGLWKGLRGAKLVEFMKKEYPGRKTNWESAVKMREKRLEGGDYKTEMKSFKK